MITVDCVSDAFKPARTMHHMKLVSDAFKPARLCLDQHHMKLVSDAFKPARTMTRSASHEACF